VPELPLDVGRGFPLLQEETRVGVPEAVEMEVSREPRLFQDALEPLRDVVEV
jgi:hypothetical protein